MTIRPPAAAVWERPTLRRYLVSYGLVTREAGVYRRAGRVASQE